jgi:hypothetical protein
MEESMENIACLLGCGAGVSAMLVLGAGMPPAIENAVLHGFGMFCGGSIGILGTKMTFSSKAFVPSPYLAEMKRILAAPYI